MRALLLSLMVTLAPTTLAASDAPPIARIVDEHILPGYQSLAQSSDTLAKQAEMECTPGSASLQQAYHDAFDAWIRVSHLRFGPSEVDDRAFALAFWPDPRSKTPKALAQMIAQEDPAAFDHAAFRDVSIAARGFYALEYLLFDAQFRAPEAYACALIRAVSVDIAQNTDAILAGWQSGYAELLRNPGNDTFRTDNEAARQLFTSLLLGLEFTAQTRLARPMGTFERPRPNRAEARRSGRSLRHVILSLDATRELAALLSTDAPEIDTMFATALKKAERLDDPTLARVATPQGRFEVEVLQQSIDMIRTALAEDLGAELGIAAGFNALDGD